MASIEGRRGMPRTRPPYPAVAGLFGKPTNINNVETYANVPWIINNGAEAFAAQGTASSKGTKIFSLTGKDRQRRPGRGADGRHAAPRHLRHRRRRAPADAVQGGAAGRAVGRLPAARACSTSRSTTRASSRPGR